MNHYSDGTFYQEGPQLINEIKERGHDVFLDFKTGRHPEYSW